MADGQRQLHPGQKVLTFAAGKQGQQVGTGECYDLADRALTGAGAKSAPQLRPDRRRRRLTWSRPVELKDVEAGDILQLRDHRITTRTDTTIKEADHRADPRRGRRNEAARNEGRLSACLARYQRRTRRPRSTS